MIANNTGDISKYIENGKNGFIVDDNWKDIKRCLDRVVCLTIGEQKRMRTSARKVAENSFDFRKYDIQIESFLSEVVGGKNGK